MEFEVGNKVEVVGKDYRGHTMLAEKYGCLGVVTVACDAEGDAEVYTPDNKQYLGCYPPSSLKLIKKGKDMEEQEIKVGQVWKMTSNGVVATITKIDGLRVYFDYVWPSGEGDGTDRFSDDFLKKYKLIKDIEGEEKKMTKPKGLKLRKGLLVESGEGLIGRIIFSEDGEYVCRVTDKGGLFVASIDELTIVTQDSAKDIAYKAPTKKKATPKKKKKAAPKKKAGK